MNKAALTRLRGVFLVLTVLVGGTASFGSALAANAEKFDIYGVRLYMGEGETLAALKQRFGENISPIITPDPNGSSETIVVTDPTFELKITLFERLPPTTTSKYQVQSIRIKLMANSDEFRRDFTKKLVAKYGEPQMRGEFNVSSWCVILGDRCYFRYPVMVYSGDSLDLTDWNLQSRNDQYRVHAADRAPPQP